ncbi:conserved hypothetical protein [Culex quinquefasciatus]|uniref:Uncharacterized protein n=1 Tax=Culex quinquefasciatus TaxID=7176 RepID=B0XFF3_CULQU|nr:conserved hypothetical protein [Culex quinquefasciatus]|eukprot:XP_001868375.1 conserved hypothetical protein [Culex quinquefasciatus]
MPESRDEICQLMDKLLLHSLDLMEQEVKLKTTIEAIANDGQLDLAHTRFTKGATAVSAVQLPTEDYKPFSALNTCSPKQQARKASAFSIPAPPVTGEALRYPKRQYRNLRKSICIIVRPIASAAAGAA